MYAKNTVMYCYFRLPLSECTECQLYHVWYYSFEFILYILLYLILLFALHMVCVYKVDVYFCFIVSKYHDSM